MLKKPIRISLLFICTIVSACIAFMIARQNNSTTQELAKRTETILHKKEKLASTYLDSIAAFLKYSKANTLFYKYAEPLVELYKNEGIAIYVYKKDSLFFWSDNQPAIDLYSYPNSFNTPLLKTRNGWYERIKKEEDTTSAYSILALITIKHEYDFENRYLNNNFDAGFELPESTRLITVANYPPHTIKSEYGIPLFQISRNDGLYKDKTLNAYACFFAALAFLVFFLGLFIFLKSKIKSNSLFVVLYSIICLITRTAMIYFKFPAIFYGSSLYDATVFANASSFYFSFMGDIFMNALVLFILSVCIYKLEGTSAINTRYKKLVVFIIGSLILIYFSFKIPFLINSLVNNTTISYNINDLFNFTGYSLVGFLSVAFILFAFYLLIEKVIILVLSNNLLNLTALTFCALTLLFSFLMIKYKNLSALDYLWSIPLVIISYLLQKYKATYNFINVGLIILVVTLTVSAFFIKYDRLNKQQTYNALALTLTDRQDVIAENEFSKISSSIRNDMTVKNLLSSLPLNGEQIEQRLRQEHFSGYFERYDIIMSLFKNDSTPVFNISNINYLNENYFKRQIKEGFQTISDDMRFIDKKNQPIRYIAKINLVDASKNIKKPFRLYLQLEPKTAGDLGAFPDLLIDKSVQRKLESKQLSYAIYESNKLLSSYGEYQYILFMKNNTFKQDDEDNYEHFIYKNENIKTIITDKKFGFWQKFTSNSYLFVFFSILVLICVFFNTIVIKHSQVFNSLNNRIQFIFVSIVVLSLAGVVVGTVWVVNSQFELKNKKELISKSLLVRKELKQTVGQQDMLEPSYKDYTSYTLKKLALLFGSDISLFNDKGVLFSTSQPAIYEQGLISKFMNPIAYTNLLKETKSNYSHKESIGNLNYLSAYIRFFNKNDKLLGYINLPYFSRQKDLENELTAYLTTLLNIYTVLFVITTLIALLVSNLLTKPLRIIKQQISNIKFVGNNESLVWKSNDEIGNLVTEYNNMLVKLEKNSELLVKSERESAWREMAKQVAHEIKNPLTPMKLTIQHLQRVVQTNPDDIKERVDKVSQILIEQIDTLSHIANEFSNFAKLPKANLETVNIFEVLQNVTQLFKQNTDCEIQLAAEAPAYIRADKEQCLRIFTNLLKNAEQSIPQNRKGKIKIELNENPDFISIHVKDNGCGIPDDKKHHLFTPNFTTKSTGTGLGLAMVKSSVVSFNGSISFDSVVDIGTTFTLIFPKATTAIN